MMLLHHGPPRSLLCFVCLNIVGLNIVGVVSAAELRVTQDVNDAQADVCVIDDFQNLRNSLGGYRNGFMREPSSVECGRVLETAHGNLCLRITADRAESGFCGGWIHLFNMKEADAGMVNSAGWSHLAFRVRGANGGEVFNLRLADAEATRKEHAWTIGAITDWLPQGVTDQWQDVMVPLPFIRGLNRTELSSISFEFTQPGTHTVFIDDLCLTRGASIRPSQLPLPEATATGAELNPASAEHSGQWKRQRAMWVWRTVDVITNTDEADELLAVCVEDGIRELWMQLPYGTTRTATGLTCELKYQPELRQFHRRAHAAGIEVHALDGYPEFALADQHATPLAALDGVIAFNQQSAPEERFTGVHYDNEPYLLLGWSNRRIREQVLFDLLTLCAACQERATAHGLKFGVDIPFWWNSRDPQTGGSSGDVTFRGVRKSATYHLIDLLDNVGVMNYRDRADGADGMLSHGDEILAYADQAGGAEILMGVETFQYEPQLVWFALGLDEADYIATLEDRGFDFSLRSRVNSLRFYRMESGNSVHIGVEIPRPDARNFGINPDRTIQKVARRFGHWSGRERDEEVLAEVQKHIQQSSEWTGFETRPVSDEELDLNFSGFITTRLMSSKVTFADDPAERFDEETRFAEAGFSQHHSFRALAIHSWNAYRKLRACRTVAPRQASQPETTAFGRR